MAETNEYRPTGMGNEVLYRDGYCVSYNGSGALMADNGGEETALVVGGSYYILNGDFRDEYASLPDVGACLEFFIGRPELVSSWSNSIESATERMRGAP